MRLTLERYTFKEVVVPFCLAVLIMVILMLIQRMILVTEWVVNRGVPIIYVLKTLALMLPFFLTLGIPVALLLATLLAVNRLSADSEITAMKAAGISVTSLLPPVIVLGVLCTAATAFLSFFIIPRASEYSKELKNVRTVARAGLKEKGFVEVGSQFFIYVDSMEKDLLKGVMLARVNSVKKDVEGRDQLDEIFIFGKEGHITADPDLPINYLHLDDGEIQTFEKEEKVFRSIKFGSFDFKIDTSKEKTPGLEGGAAFELMDMTTLEQKKAEITSRLNQVNSADPNDKMAQLAQKRFHVALRQIEIARYQKFSLPFACIILALWGVPLGIQPPRTTRHQGIVTSIFLTLTYYALVSGGKILAVKGFILPFWALWGPNFIVILSGAWLIHRVANDRSLPLSNVTARIAEWGSLLNNKIPREKPQ
jgi:lipopolysaccharide export system permease protein